MPTIVRNDKIAFWLAKDYSVLFLGREGVGKTALVREGLEKNGFEIGKDAVYYSTHDRNFVGGDPYTAKVLVLDDLNNEAAREAVIELTGLRAWKGRPVVGVVWGAYTLGVDDQGYTADVPPEVKAALEKFETVVEIPYKPFGPYFVEKYGDRIAKAAIEWWDYLPDDVKKMCPPRRLDQALETYRKNGDMRDVLPITSNVSRLLSLLSTGPITEHLEKLLTDKDEAKAKTFLANDNNYASAMRYIPSSETMSLFFLPLISAEKLAGLMAVDDKVFMHVLKNAETVPHYMSVCKQILVAQTSQRMVKRIRRHWVEFPPKKAQQ